MSGIIFAGCSHTHGHGLWFYCKDLYDQYKGILDIDPIIEDRPIHHLRYKDIFRFPRLVSQELEMFEITRDNYSGNDEESVKFIDQIFDVLPSNQEWSKNNYKYDEVKYIVFQTSMPERCHYINPDGSKFRLSDHVKRLGDDEHTAYKLLKKYHFIDYEDYKHKLCRQLFIRIKEIFVRYENKGIIPLIFNWSNDYNELIEGEDYMNQRKIYIKNKNKEFNSLIDLWDDDKNLLINTDYEFFGENPPSDLHPSKKCHRIIADSIIEKIRFIEKNTLTNPYL